MNLNQLYYFKKLAELLHFTNTAKELFITQPSLSGSISSLEVELGIELFHRQGRSVKLTKYGNEFYKHVSTALNELEKGIEIAKEESGALGGQINVGCIPTIIGDFLPTVINRYLSTVNSKTRFNVFNGMTFDVTEGIKSGKYDIGFCSFVEDESSLEFVPVLAQELVLLVNKFNPLAKKKFVHMDDLHDCPLITYRDNLPIGKTIMNIIKAHDLHATFAYDDEITIGGVVATTELAAITARTPFLLQFRNLRLIKIDVPADTRKLYMCYSKENYRSRPAEIFAKYILENERKL
jgi:DNA-binding transcriptional LysR family regulator